MIAVLLLALLLSVSEPANCHTSVLPLIDADGAHGASVPFPVDGAAVKFRCSF